MQELRLGEPKEMSGSDGLTTNVPAPTTGPITSAKLLELLERQERRCALTGRALAPETASLDHIIPVSAGGAHDMSNVQILHRDVNTAKHTLSQDDFVMICREVVAHASNQEME